MEGVQKCLAGIACATSDQSLTPMQRPARRLLPHCRTPGLKARLGCCLTPALVNPPITLRPACKIDAELRPCCDVVVHLIHLKPLSCASYASRKLKLLARYQDGDTLRGPGCCPVTGHASYYATSILVSCSRTFTGLTRPFLLSEVITMSTTTAQASREHDALAPSDAGENQSPNLVKV